MLTLKCSHPKMTQPSAYDSDIWKSMQNLLIQNQVFNYINSREFVMQENKTTTFCFLLDSWDKCQKSDRLGEKRAKCENWNNFSVFFYYDVGLLGVQVYSSSEGDDFGFSPWLLKCVVRSCPGFRVPFSRGEIFPRDLAPVSLFHQEAECCRNRRKAGLTW